jgi:O-antigen ligase
MAGSALILSLFLLIVLANSTWVLEQLGKDLTFTGRTAVWVDVWAKIGERPWLGFGYNAFWLGAESEAADIWRVHGWQPNHAHNGYLDLWLELGLVGVTLVLVHLLLNTRRAFLWAVTSKTAESLWPLVYITLLFMFNFNYSVLVSQSIFFWIVYLGAVYRAKLELRHHYRSAHKPSGTASLLPAGSAPLPS